MMEAPYSPAGGGPMDQEPSIKHVNLDDIPDVRETPEARELGMAGATHYDTKPNLADGQSRELKPPWADEFWLSQETRRKYGIKDGEDYAWALDTTRGNWAQAVAADGVQDALDNNVGARVIINPDTGQPVRRRDVALIARDRQAVDDRDARDRKVREEFERQCREDELPGNWDPEDNEMIRRLRAQNKVALRASGFIGQTQGMSFRDVLRTKTAEEVAAEATRYRRGGRSSIEMSDEQAEAADKAQRAQRGTRTFSGLGGLGAKK